MSNSLKTESAVVVSLPNCCSNFLGCKAYNTRVLLLGTQEHISHVCELRDAENSCIIIAVDSRGFLDAKVKHLALPLQVYLESLVPLESMDSLAHLAHLEEVVNQDCLVL